MMWYKSFALWMIIKRGYNVLFQDVDLVWFRDPFTYLKNLINSPELRTNGRQIDAIFTDDGQRGLRYSPFYANSGFYYIVASDRATYFAWSIMTVGVCYSINGPSWTNSRCILRDFQWSSALDRIKTCLLCKYYSTSIIIMFILKRRIKIIISPPLTVCQSGDCRRLWTLQIFGANS